MLIGLSSDRSDGNLPTKERRSEAPQGGLFEDVFDAEVPAGELEAEETLPVATDSGLRA